MGSIHALVFTPEGTRLISAGADRLIRVWDTADGCLLQTLEGHSKPVYSLALGQDGRQLASAGADGSIKIWELSEGRLIRSLTGHTNWIFGLAFHPDGTRIASRGRWHRASLGDWRRPGDPHSPWS
jgi:WD40 repeat protein